LCGQEFPSEQTRFISRDLKVNRGFRESLVKGGGRKPDGHDQQRQANGEKSKITGSESLAQASILLSCRLPQHIEPEGYSTSPSAGTPAFWL
jgi:hypothetical protein